MLRSCVMIPEDARLPGGWSAEGNFLVRRADGKTLPFVLTSYREDRPTRRDIRCRIVRALREEHLAARDPAPQQADLVLAVGELMREFAPAYRAELLSRALRASPRERAELRRRIDDLDSAMETHRRRMLAFETAGRPSSQPRRNAARPRARSAGSRAPVRRRSATSARRASPRATATGTSTSPPAPSGTADRHAVASRPRATERLGRVVARRSGPGIARALLLAITVAILLTFLPPRIPRPRQVTA